MWDTIKEAATGDRRPATGDRAIGKENHVQLRKISPRRTEEKIMQNHTVTASNSSFWMTLSVNAKSLAHAEAAFDAYIARINAENSEFSMVDLEASPDATPEDFHYRYNPGRIEVDDLTGHDESVIMLDSGSNG